MNRWIFATGMIYLSLSVGNYLGQVDAWMARWGCICFAVALFTSPRDL